MCKLHCAEGSMLASCYGTTTTKKQALGPPQKYRYGDEPVPIPIHLNTGTFGVDEIFE